MKVWLDTSDLATIEQFAIAKGTSLGTSRRQIDVYFKEHGFRNESQGPGSYLVRVRYSDNRASLNMKRLTTRDGVWEEIETSVKKGEVVEEIIEVIGAERAVRVVKDRRECMIDDIEMIIDDVKDLGVFLEIAIICTEDNVELSQKKLKEFLQEIGIDQSRIELRGYPTILLEREGVKFLAK